MEQRTHLHCPAPGARVRVWGRGAHEARRGGLRGSGGGPRSTGGGSPEAAASTPEIGARRCGVAGGTEGVVRRTYAGEVFPWGRR